MSMEDPRKIYSRPPYSDKQQPPPGSEEEMSPKVDHGESSYHGTGRLKSRSALVTGADSGIGRAVALAFAREGADVAISYLSEDRDAKETERLVTQAGRKAVLLPGDIGERFVPQAVARKAVDAFGTIDILVNNAAFQRSYERFEDISDDEFEETYRVNVFAMFRLCQALLPQMKEGGSIINTPLPCPKRRSNNSVHRPSSDVPPNRLRSPPSSSSWPASYVTGEIYGATGGQMPM